jgi:acyl-CoA synthetase (AMP-forming)/AMP-acid ligase II
MIVTEGGKNIYPEDIEASFSDLKSCEEYCVFAANYLWPKGSMQNEKLMIVVRPTADANLEALVEEIRHKNRALADFKRLSSYTIWREDFPRTASQKIKRIELAKTVATHSDRDEALVALGEGA